MFVHYRMIYENKFKLCMAYPCPRGAYYGPSFLCSELGLLRKRYMPKVQNGKEALMKKPKLCTGDVI